MTDLEILKWALGVIAGTVLLASLKHIWKATKWTGLAFWHVGTAPFGAIVKAWDWFDKTPNQREAAPSGYSDRAEGKGPLVFASGPQKGQPIGEVGEKMVNEVRSEKLQIKVGEMWGIRSGKEVTVTRVTDGKVFVRTKKGSEGDFSPSYIRAHWTKIREADGTEIGDDEIKVGEIWGDDEGFHWMIKHVTEETIFVGGNDFPKKYFLNEWAKIREVDGTKVKKKKPGTTNTGAR